MHIPYCFNPLERRHREPQGCRAIGAIGPPSAGRRPTGYAGRAASSILDTCFSSALSPVFIKFVPVGGAVVCADGFTTANGMRTVGSILNAVIDNYGALVGSSSISLLLNKPHGKTLFTTNSGKARRATLDTKKEYSMDTDTKIELKELDLYLRREGVMVTPVEADKLKTLLTENLKMTVM